MKTLIDHKKEVEKLGELESRLIDIIGKIGDNSLMDCYNEYQEQKIVCNNLYLEILPSLMSLDSIGRAQFEFEGKRIDNGDTVRGNLVEDRSGNAWIFEKSPIQKYQVPLHGKIVGCDRIFCNQIDPSTIKTYQV